MAAGPANDVGAAALNSTWTRWSFLSRVKNVEGSAREQSEGVGQARHGPPGGAQVMGAGQKPLLHGPRPQRLVRAEMLAEQSREIIVRACSQPCERGVPLGNKGRDDCLHPLAQVGRAGRPVPQRGGERNRTLVADLFVEEDLTVLTRQDGFEELPREMLGSELRSHLHYCLMAPELIRGRPGIRHVLHDHPLYELPPRPWRHGL